MNDKTVTFSQAGDGKYNVLIQDKNGRVIVNKRGISRREAMFEIDQHVNEEVRFGTTKR